MENRNKKIRRAMFEAEIKQWELAKILRVGETTLCRRLRDELPEDEQNRIVDLIRKHKEEGAPPCQPD